MGFLDFFRRPPIRDAGDLGQFIDENAAFLTQKGIYEYSRARAGHYAKVMFFERDFLAAVEVSRWRAYPLGLAMVGELVEGVLLPHALVPRHEQLGALSELVLSVFDRYPVPAPLTAREWAEAREELARRLQHVGLHPPKRAFQIPTPLADAYFSLMPIDAKLRAPDAPTLRNYLKATLCNMHEELTRRMDGPAVARSLTYGRT